MTNLLDDQPIADAIAAAIAAQVGTGVPVGDRDEFAGIHSTKPDAATPVVHVAIDVSRVDAFVSRRASGEVSLPDRKLVTHCHGDSVALVRDLVRRVGLALEDVVLTIPGDTVGPFTFDIAEPVEADDTGWVARVHWRFV